MSRRAGFRVGLPTPVLNLLNSHLAVRTVMRRPPNVVIGGTVNPYLERWHLIPRNPVFNVYLHRIIRSDDDRALHDHPWVNLSILLAGRYVEHTIEAGGINVRTERFAGDMKLRMPWAAHRLEIVDGECWTLFVTGPRVRKWGFHCRKGWVWWKDFTAEDGRGVSTIGAGCGEFS